MNIFESIILGIIQGATEFLPISSTGHLTITGKLMGLISVENPEHWTAFIAVIQLGTLLAVLVYFRKDIFNILIDFVKDNLIKPKKFVQQNENSKMGWYIIIGSLPVAIIGLGFKDLIEGAFTKNLYVIAGGLIFFGLILGLSEKLGKFKKDIHQVKWYDALIVGFAQSFALIPGSSRSGTTITAGLFLGFDRETAARFSFLLSIPAVFGSGLLEFYQSLSFIDSTGLIAMLVATIASAISGYAAIDFLLKYLKKNNTLIFVGYRIVIGILIYVMIAYNIITP